MDQPNVVTKPREPWNKGKLVGQKAPFKLKEIWAIRIRLRLGRERTFARGHAALGPRPGSSSTTRPDLHR